MIENIQIVPYRWSIATVQPVADYGDGRSQLC